MTGLKLSTFSLVLGLAFSALQLWGLLKPAEFSAALKKFPRSIGWGYLLVALGTVWFLHNLSQENISDFAPYKPAMYVGFTALGIGACIFVQDFLAVRGLAIVLLLLAKLALDTQRWEETGWKNVITVWAYAWVVIGMWLTVSPWKLRDWIDWHTATVNRMRIGSALRLAFGIFVAGLSLHFRAVEQRSAQHVAMAAPRQVAVNSVRAE